MTTEKIENLTEDFLISRPFWIGIKDELTHQELGQLMYYVFQYAFEDIEPTIEDRFIRSQFKQAKEFMNNKKQRYDERRERISQLRSEAGKKGMQSRWGDKDNKNNKNNIDSKKDSKSVRKIDSGSITPLQDSNTPPNCSGGASVVATLKASRRRTPSPYSDDERGEIVFDPDIQ